MYHTIPLTFVIWITFLLLPPLAALDAADALVVEKIDGPVTATEIQAFKNFMRAVPPPANNLRNAMVYGSGGSSVESLGRVYEICGDRELLDLMLQFTDRMLAGRNDPQTGVIIWTGKRDLVWPNAEAKQGKPIYSSSENGDVIGHIAYAAKLMLQRRELREVRIPDGDPFGFGATYRQRADRYVREMNRSVDTFILKWLVRPGSLRYYFPDSPQFEASNRAGSADRPVPWNQQTMLNNGFQRLAECHVLLEDDAGRVKQYDAIVKASVDWFFEKLQRITVAGHACYKWAYVAEEPMRHIEDSGHGGYDVGGLYRAYLSGRYGISAAMIEPLANTVLYVMRQPDGTFQGRVDGTAGKHPPGGLRGNWIDLCEFAPPLFPLLLEVNRGRIKSSPDTTANLLWQKHRRAILPKPQPVQ